MAKKMNMSIQHWENKQWFAFGTDLGKMLQDTALTVYAQKYTIDSSGVLQRSLDSISVSSTSPTLISIGVVGRVTGFSAVCFLLVALVLKGRRWARTFFAKKPECIDAFKEV